MTNRISNEHSKGRILVVDDEVNARKGLEKLLLQEHYEVDLAEDGEKALEIAQERLPDLVITDLKMPKLDGLELLARLRELDRTVPVIVVTAFGDISSAVHAMRAGADDYLAKPIDFDALSIAIERTLLRRNLQAEAEILRRQLNERDGEGFGGLMGTSPAIRKIYRMADRIAAARATVLITGESGTGKGVLARALHEKSARAKKPFVSVHCASLTETLLESELFGHEKGSFTGADRRRIGRFEQAHGGTLFLDEIGEIPLVTQVKLLRVLQERTFERVGGNDPIAVDVRLIAATNRDLSADVAEGRFRTDLFYRLNVIHIEMPSLRARVGDIPLLAEYFLRRFAAENHKNIEYISEQARAKLLSHRWPGNVRELENAIERAVVLCDSPILEEGDLPMDGAPISRNSLSIPGSTMAEIERYAILATLDAVGGSTSKAAEMLDISVRTIQYRLHEYGLSSKERKSNL